MAEPIIDVAQPAADGEDVIPEIVINTFSFSDLSENAIFMILALSTVFTFMYISGLIDGGPMTCLNLVLLNVFLLQELTLCYFPHLDEEDPVIDVPVEHHHLFFQNIHNIPHIMNRAEARRG